MTKATLKLYAFTRSEGEVVYQHFVPRFHIHRFSVPVDSPARVHKHSKAGFVRLDPRGHLRHIGKGNISRIGGARDIYEGYSASKHSVEKYLARIEGEAGLYLIPLSAHDWSKPYVMLQNESAALGNYLYSLWLRQPHRLRQGLDSEEISNLIDDFGYAKEGNRDFEHLLQLLWLGGINANLSEVRIIEAANPIALPMDYPAHFDGERYYVPLNKKYILSGRLVFKKWAHNPKQVLVPYREVLSHDEFGENVPSFSELLVNAGRNRISDGRFVFHFADMRYIHRELFAAQDRGLYGSLEINDVDFRFFERNNELLFHPRVLDKAASQLRVDS